MRSHRVPVVASLPTLLIIASLVSLLPGPAAGAFAYDRGVQAGRAGLGSGSPVLDAVAVHPDESSIQGYGYDDSVHFAYTNAPRSSGFFAPQTAAHNAADFARLTKQLQFDEAASVFTKSGGLQPSVIQDARLITPGARIGNPEVIKALTADGSNIADWGKYATQTFQSPSGPFQAHFYRNSVTGAADYSIDYKVVFGSPR